MNYSPLQPTPEEIRELACHPHLQEHADSNEDMEAILESLYLVKFNFMNGSPGYCGDLFLIQSDHLSDEIPVVRFIRDNEGSLKPADPVFA